MHIPQLAQQLADQLASIEGIKAVVLGGSWARGAATPNSDIDLGIYYDPDSRPSVNELRKLAQQLDDSHSDSLVTHYGEWGQWINGGGWLTINNQRVDWLYKDLQWVEHHINECVAGRPVAYYQPGHPHAFYNHIYLGEVFYSIPLYDPQGILARLKTFATPYPPLLKKALIHSLWEAGFALDTAKKSAERGESFYVAGCLFRSAACMVQALYALNEQYCINEKGSLRAIESFSHRPESFAQIVSAVLGQPGTTPDELNSSLAQFESLLASIRVFV